MNNKIFGFRYIGSKKQGSRTFYLFEKVDENKPLYLISERKSYFLNSKKTRNFSDIELYIKNYKYLKDC